MHVCVCVCVCVCVYVYPPANPHSLVEHLEHVCIVVEPLTNFAQAGDAVIALHCRVDLLLPQLRLCPINETLYILALSVSL